jgi:hypothetical protein
MCASAPSYTKRAKAAALFLFSVPTCAYAYCVYFYLFVPPSPLFAKAESTVGRFSSAEGLRA